MRKLDRNLVTCMLLTVTWQNVMCSVNAVFISYCKFLVSDSVCLLYLKFVTRG